MASEFDALARSPQNYEMLPKGRYQPWLRLWRYPNFDYRTVWSVHQVDGSLPSGASPFVVRRLVDVYDSEFPHIDGSEVQLMTADIEPLAEELYGVHIPLFRRPLPVKGRGGTVYGL